MKSVIAIFAIASLAISLAAAQEASESVLRKGVSVQMPVASHAVEMRAADKGDATVVAITAAGKIYVGIEPTEPGALGALKAGTVYVKADSRVPFQTVLSVLDALRGKSVVLLSASPAGASVSRGKIVAPYGLALTVSQ